MHDLTNRTFGRLKAIEPTEQRYHGKIVWRCLCECKREVLVPSTLLTRGAKRSCGCLQDDNRRKDITNQTRGHLTALYPSGAYEDGQTVWVWRCQCGKLLHKPLSAVGYGGMTMCPDCAYRLKQDQAVAMASKVERDEAGRSVKQVADIMAGRVTAQNSSGVRGVSWHKGQQKWTARISDGHGKTRTLGYYDTIEAAAYARKLASEMLYGKEDKP